MGSKDHTSIPRLVDASSGMLSLSSDGSVNWPRTLRLAKHAWRDGVQQAIVITDFACHDVLHRRMPHFLGLLSQHQIPIEVLGALEMTLHSDLFAQVELSSNLIAGPVQRYVFLRLSAETTLPILPVIESLRDKGFTTVIMVPERCTRFRDGISELQQIVSIGGLLQLSAASLLDQSDRGRIRFCRQLIRKSLCHVVATESGRHHDLPISLSEAYAAIARWEGLEVANALCCCNPNCLFEGRPVDATPKRQTIRRYFSRAA